MARSFWMSARPALTRQKIPRTQTQIQRPSTTIMASLTVTNIWQELCPVALVWVEASTKDASLKWALAVFLAVPVSLDEPAWMKAHRLTVRDLLHCAVEAHQHNSKKKTMRPTDTTIARTIICLSRCVLPATRDSVVSQRGPTVTYRTCLIHHTEETHDVLASVDLPHPGLLPP